MYKYKKVSDDLTLQIQNGRQPIGSRLPSIRDCAQHYQVSINTVKEAYRQLEDQGLISVRPQSGYYVCHAPSNLLELEERYVSEEKVSLSGISCFLAQIVKKQMDPDYVNLALACPSGENFYPIERLKRLTTQVLRTQPDIFKSYTLPPGSIRLRTQIARRSLQLGMFLSADDIVLTHGTMEALSLAIMATTQAGDSIALEIPTFHNLYPLLQNLGRKIVEVPTSPHTGMCLDALEELLKSQSVQAILTIPTGHNPLGFSMPENNRRRLAELANQFQIPVIEDAMYAELQLTEPLLPNIKAFDQNGWVLVCGSYTKTVAPDYRIGWLEAGRFRNIVQQLKFTTTVAEPALLTETLGLFLENGGYDLHLRQLKKRYQQQIDTIKSYICRYFPVGTRVSRPQAGFILWLELPESIDTLELFHQAMDEKILCMPGILCSADKRFSHCLRIAACFELNPKMLNALMRLGELAKNMLPVQKAIDQIPTNSVG